MSAGTKPGTKVVGTLSATLLFFFLCAPPQAMALGRSGAMVEAAKLSHGSGHNEDAAVLFERAARAGNRYAQYRYAMMLFEGSAHSPESHAVWRWLRRAAGAGLPQAQFEFAQRYERGDLVTPSSSVAIEWYSRAARQGHAEAQVRLAGLLLERHETSGAIPDRDQALRWLGAAARSGHTEAITTLQRLGATEAR